MGGTFGEQFHRVGINVDVAEIRGVGFDALADASPSKADPNQIRLLPPSGRLRSPLCSCFASPIPLCSWRPERGGMLGL